MFRNKNYSHLQDLNGELEVVFVEPEVVEVQKSDKDRILEMIYCPDPITHLPQNDIGFYLSKDTPDSVREFIERNIFSDMSEKVTPPSGVDDDTIIELTRDRYETREEYVKRVNEFMKRQKDSFESEYHKEVVKRSKSKKD